MSNMSIYVPCVNTLLLKMRLCRALYRTLHGTLHGTLIEDLTPLHDSVVMVPSCVFMRHYKVTLMRKHFILKFLTDSERDASRTFLFRDHIFVLLRGLQDII